MPNGHEPPATPQGPPASGEGAPQRAPAGRRPPRPKKPHKKISWRISAVVTVVLVAATIIIMVAILLGGYNNYQSMKRIISGAGDVTLHVQTDRDTLLNNGADVLAGEKTLADILRGMGAQNASDVKIVLPQ